MEFPTYGIIIIMVFMCADPTHMCPGPSPSLVLQVEHSLALLPVLLLRLHLREAGASGKLEVLEVD